MPPVRMFLFDTPNCIVHGESTSHGTQVADCTFLMHHVQNDILLDFLAGTQWKIMNKHELKDDVDYALRELGIEYIDIIVLCRVSPIFSIEER